MARGARSVEICVMEVYGVVSAHMQGATDRGTILRAVV
jgi:hypothetical protein